MVRSRPPGKMTLTEFLQKTYFGLATDDVLRRTVYGMKKAKAVQIAAVVASLTLFSAYVVYSQLKQGTAVAPSSKLLVLTNSRTISPAKTNAIQTLAQDPNVAHSNASPNFLLLAEIRSNPPPAKSQTVFPGSKSPAVFAPEQIQRFDLKTK